MIRPNDEFRRPPANPAAELGAIGSMLLAGAAIADVAALAGPGDFSLASHQVLCRAILDLHGRGVPVDAVTLCEDLARRGELADAGGPEAISAALDMTPHPANAAFYAGIVRDKATLRRLIDAAAETLEDCYSGRLSAADALAAAERRVLALDEPVAVGATTPLGPLLAAAMDRLARRFAGECGGLAIGFRDLDAMLDGLAPATLNVLAARPSMGKTACALQIASHASMRAGVPALYVSLEMSGIEVAERILVAQAGVDGHRVRTGHLTRDDRDALARAFDAATAAGDGRLWVDDTASRSVAQIAANARRLKARHGLGLVAVDYLQLLAVGGDVDGRASRQEIVASFSRGLKSLARELRLPVLALSQLNRLVEAREEKRPRMSDIRESGALENDADTILLLHRPDYYDPDDQPGLAELIVAKNRNGPTGTVRLAFEKALARFADLAQAQDIGAY